MNNVFLTGHQAYLTSGALEQIAAVTLKNITNFFWEKAEQPLANQVFIFCFFFCFCFVLFCLFFLFNYYYYYFFFIDSFIKFLPFEKLGP